MAFCTVLLFATAVLAQAQVSPVDSTAGGKSGRDRIRVRPDSAAISNEPSPSNLPGLPAEKPAKSIVERDAAPPIVDPRNDSLSRKERRRSGLLPPDPDVAVRRSLFLPGWGQAYNRSWWKVPIVYAGFGAIGFFVVDNHRQYKYHQAAAICVGDTNCTDYPEFSGFSVSNVISIRDFHRRFRDLSVIIGGLWYGIQAIDAYIEAHLKPFNVNEDLSLRVKPTINMDPFRPRQPFYLGATISLNLRK